MLMIATDFAKLPVGRYPKDGPFNGEKFRLEFLVPKLKDFDRVVVDLTGTLGAGSSFLDEAFGGLIRDEGFTVSQLEGKLDIRSDDDSEVVQIWEYIRSARARNARH